MHNLLQCFAASNHAVNTAAAIDIDEAVPRVIEHVTKVYRVLITEPYRRFDLLHHLRKLIIHDQRAVAADGNADVAINAKKYIQTVSHFL